MTRDERVYYYQNLLMLAYMPLVVVGIEMVLERFPLPEANPRKCDIIIENTDYHRRCQQYNDDWRPAETVSR